jgi:plasmid stabilization system protein ParE
LSYKLHRDAEVDLVDAVRFYRREAGRAVANRFLDEFERVAELLVSNPNLGTTTGDQRRGFPLHGFPYSIIYRAVEGGMRILVVRHQHRDPEYGERRR